MSANKTGVALGGGIEWLLGDNWSMKADYQSIRLGAMSSQTSATTVFGPSALPTDAMSLKPSSAQFNLFRLGLDYHFGSERAEVGGRRARPRQRSARRLVGVFGDWKGRDGPARAPSNRELVGHPVRPGSPVGPDAAPPRRWARRGARVSTPVICRGVRITTRPRPAGLCFNPEGSFS